MPGGSPHQHSHLHSLGLTLLDSFDVSKKIDERSVFGFLEDCLEDGLILAPGPSFGVGFETSVRLCFTSAPPVRVERAALLLAQRLDISHTPINTI
jgi:hypothetical protein